jgi:hypothetical protein
LVIGTGWMFLADKPMTAANGQMLANTPPGGDEAEIRVIRLSPAERMAAPDDKVAATPAAVPATRTITIIDGTSGKRQEVEIPVAADDTPNRVADVRPEPNPPVPPVRAAAERSRPSEAGVRRAKNSPAKPTTP